MMEKKPAIMNAIWIFMILISILVAAYVGNMEGITKASYESAKAAVMLAISLVGAMALWLGIMKVAEAAGLMKIVAKAIRPLMIRLFPDVPSDHPAMPAMIMNFAANMLGLGNAATPMGIKAMTELDKLNPRKGTATNAMCLFLAINTSSITIFPLGAIAVRAAAGAKNPADILLPSILATAFSTTVAILVSKLFARFNPDPELLPQSATATDGGISEGEVKQEGSEFIAKVSKFGKIVALLMTIAFFAAIPYHFIKAGHAPTFNYQLIVSGTAWLIPLLMGFFLLIGYFRNVKVYETLTEGAKDGFQVAIKIIPFMVAIFVAIGMFRESGALDLFTRLVSPLTSLIGMPAEALPMMFLRPLSGTGAFGYMSEVVQNSPDSFASYLVSVMNGCSETTFYVMAVYFGAIGIKQTRWVLYAALIGDFAGMIGSLFICKLLY